MKLKLKLTILSLISTSQVGMAQTHQEQQNAFIANLTKNSVTSLDQVPGVLSPTFLSNFIIKHGLEHDGPRGHKLEADVPGMGIHASVDKPRIYIFDPKTGAAISFNSDGSQQGGNSLDLMTYEDATKSFQFRKIDFPTQAGKYALSDQSCTACHGGMAKNEKIRPIFSMYPDWPRFFGSDNDELKLGEKYPTPESIPASTDLVTRERIKMQHLEHDAFFQFKYVIAPAHPRYAPLFSPQAYAVHGFPEKPEQYREYPYRSDVEEIGSKLDPSDVSRAFTRRAGLRFNLLYSRLNARQVVNQIVSQKEQFQKFGEFFVYNIMRCGPQLSDDRVIKRWRTDLLKALQKIESDKSIEYNSWNAAGALAGQPLMPQGTFSLGGDLKLIGKKQALLEYGQNLALFGLKINDVDMRFTYYHPDYLPTNAFRNLAPLEVMQVGYLDMCGDPKGSCEKYYNAYNDGSTTIDEHMTASLLLEIAKNNKPLRDLLKAKGASAIRGLLDKYSGATYQNRLKLDRPFFTQMDSLSKWFSLPYPYKEGDKGVATSFIGMHHRAPFNSNYQNNYKQVCAILEKDLLK